MIDQGRQRPGCQGRDNFNLGPCSRFMLNEIERLGKYFVEITNAVVVGATFLCVALCVLLHYEGLLLTTRGLGRLGSTILLLNFFSMHVRRR